MILGDITINNVKGPAPQGEFYCEACGDECECVTVDHSFDDVFGAVTNIGHGSDCCEAPCTPIRK